MGENRKEQVRAKTTATPVRTDVNGSPQETWPALVEEFLEIDKECPEDGATEPSEGHRAFVESDDEARNLIAITVPAEGRSFFPDQTPFYFGAGSKKERNDMFKLARSWNIPESAAAYLQTADGKINADLPWDKNRNPAIGAWTMTCEKALRDARAEGRAVTPVVAQVLMLLLN